MKTHGSRMAVSHLKFPSGLEIALSLQAFEWCGEQLKLFTGGGGSLTLLWYLEGVRRNAV